ncbi:TPA: hypothetical protein ACTW38_004834 [Klebsiella michiganensis]
MKKKKASEPVLLTSDSDWHNNACLNYMSDHGTAYTEGYRRAGDIDVSGRVQNFLVYPVLFLYRHHIELLIKQIVGLALVLSEVPDTDQYKKDNHNLNTLWLLVKKLLPEVNDSHRSSNFRLIKEVVKKLHNAHRLVTDLRYAR